MTNKRIEQSKVLILCLADPSTNPRPQRVIELCRSAGYSVSVAGFMPKYKIDIQSFVLIQNPPNSLKSKILTGFLYLFAFCLPGTKLQQILDAIRYGYHEIRKPLKSQSYDIIIVEDLQLLPMAFDISGDGKVIFDAREFYPRLHEESIIFNIFGKPKYVRLCNDYLPRCDVILTVSEGLRDEYKKEFGVNAEVYMSTSYYQDISVQPTNPDKIRIIYHGVANRNRQLEKMIDIFMLLDERFYFSFVLVGNEKYQDELRRKAKLLPRIRFLKPVPLNDIAMEFNSYDLGLLYFEPVTFNLKHCLPNKFFECIQSRLMIAIGPSPDMAALVKKYNCGIVAKDFTVTDMAAALNSLTTETIYNAKRNSNLAAKELCFEKESMKLLKILDSLFEKKND